MELLKFLQNYWREIVDVVAIVASIVFCLIRKKPVKVIDTLSEMIVKVLPAFIIASESAEKGKKLEVCLELLKKYFKDQYDIDLTESQLSFASDQVEYILSTPQKKGR